ncbi:EAL domain-containing protein, partial [Klebsiella pneumoniae]
DNQQFAIWLQPQVACASGEICGAEVLLRQRQADGSWSLPPALIERIESCGLIIPVGYWVMEEACRQLAAWQSQGIMLPLSVNVSLLQLLEHDRGEEMLKLIARYRIAPGTLILEVTESCRMDDPQDVMARLRPLREAGVQIALDDFGMGYAGLHQLQQMKALPVDILKIDKVFIDMLPEDVSMVPAMIQLARGLSLRIVAEGVENDAQYRWLQAAGVEVLQGHLFGCALPQEAFSARYLSPAREDENL